MTVPCSVQNYQMLSLLGKVALDELSHWGRVTHIWLGNLTFIGSDYGLLPGRNIVNWTLRNKLQRNFSRNSNIFIQEMHLKRLSAKCRSFYLGLNVLNFARFELRTSLLYCHRPLGYVGLIFVVFLYRKMNATSKKYTNFPILFLICVISVVRLTLAWPNRCSLI